MVWLSCYDLGTTANRDRAFIFRTQPTISLRSWVNRSEKTTLEAGCCVCILSTIPNQSRFILHIERLSLDSGLWTCGLNSPTCARSALPCFVPINICLSTERRKPFGSMPYLKAIVVVRSLLWRSLEVTQRRSEIYWWISGVSILPSPYLHCHVFKLTRCDDAER